MADIYHYIFCRLVTILYLLTGVSGDTRSLYTRVGDNVSLSCTNVVYPNCSSTTWNYHRTGLESVIEEVGHGKIKTNSKRANRLKVGSDCSLHVSDVRAEDAGIYTCRQYLSNGPQHGSDAPVHLSVLTNSSSTPETDVKPDRPVTRCFLYTFDGPGKCRQGITEPVSLLWVDEAGNKLKNDSRHQVTQTSECDITLTVTLQKEDNNRKWTCQLIIDGKKEISIDFTSMVPGITYSTQGPAWSPTSPHSEKSPYVNLMYVFVGVAIVVAVCVVAAVIILHRRKKNQIPAYGGPARNKDLGLTAVNSTSPPANEDRSQPADCITYASIGHIDRDPPQNVDAHGEDSVTYASVMTSTDRGRETENPADPNSLYSTVNKGAIKTST
ncbi:uncharacterized protein LOC105008368 isoform X1 [Esox lucius]|uniref:Ig-like domain-containing protein n=1 Tax=Esox lucius TaxID=8010 RepID=A0A3P8Z4Y5_ESOLU|nr:uncharacterized protein LOC105008368 isoform X1 [Esox lucius]